VNIKLRLRDTRGMTLIELTVATLVSLIVLSVALGFFTTEGRTLRAGSGQFALTQNYRMALSTLASQISEAGANTAGGQPTLVYAGPNAIAINADYTSPALNDIFAVTVDTAAPVAETEALQKGDALQIPGSSFTYPDTSYKMASTNSTAETMLFFFLGDSTTTRTDDYVLYRQVNKGPRAVIARNILKTGSLPFFEYLYSMSHDTMPVTVEVYGSAEMKHTAPVHGRGDGPKPDTGAVAIIDNIRGVRVNLTTTDGTTGSGERTRAVSRVILLPNAGLARLESCGEDPTLGVTMSAVVITSPPTVTLKWNAAVDEAGGEKDVMRYVIWKRLRPSTIWGPPYVSIPAGLSSYQYADNEVVHGSAYDYAIAAQDCTPSASAQSVLSNVIVP
jgi:type II secretory pathway pseudopilin PulG